MKLLTDSGLNKDLTTLKFVSTTDILPEQTLDYISQENIDFAKNNGFSLKVRETTL